MTRVVLAVLMLCRVLWGADTPEEAAKKAYLANINALMVFTTKDGLNSGTYEFTRANTSMYIIHLPLRYQFEPFAPDLNAFVIGGVGYSETKLTNDVNTSTPLSGDIALSATNMLRTYTGGIGGGLRYRPGLGFEMLGGVEAIYSRVGVSARDNNGAGDSVGDLFKESYNANISYRVFFALEYRREWKGYKPYATLTYDLYETKSAISTKQLSKFTTQTNVTSFSIGGETAALANYDGMYLTLEGYLRGSYLGGDITRVTHFDGYGTLGGVGYWYVSEAMNYIERFFLEVSTIQADGLRGYNIGLGFTLDY
ncbi:hypothetical protein LOH54_02005 [Sulfurimonas sp. HSL-3221]|uniref:hypothetical protein n=1 Tax=Sulfurimonadaceae TaxID=2771471 RepID=UPI001E3DB478|nr:hypothetical protein [Sulfurimonas sp. HSL-3221]UFS62913.1 hypothetical protein LOH54_02005 [Sulfurimonas sp. HSL-3221]